MKEIWFLHSLLGGMSKHDAKLLSHSGSASPTAVAALGERLIPRVQQASQNTKSFSETTHGVQMEVRSDSARPSPMRRPV